MQEAAGLEPCARSRKHQGPTAKAQPDEHEPKPKCSEGLARHGQAQLAASSRPGAAASHQCHVPRYLVALVYLESDPPLPLPLPGNSCWVSGAICMHPVLSAECLSLCPLVADVAWLQLPLLPVSLR